MREDHWWFLGKVMDGGKGYYILISRIVSLKDETLQISFLFFSNGLISRK